MTIRYQCPECDSVLKIKDELAGTDGKCPKCKAKFIVPEAGEAPDESVQAKPKTDQASSAPAKPTEKSGKKKTKPVAAASKSKTDDDDFDPAAFLMEDGPGAQASAGLGEAPPEEKSPATDKMGRRYYGSSAASKAKAASMSPAARAADSQLTGASTSANARDLLSKGAEDARVKASTMPVTAKKPLINFDFAGARNELLRFAPHVVGSVLGIVFLYWGMNRMLGAEVELPELGKVSGTVTMDGNPVVGVRVMFTPLDAKRSDSTEGPERLRTASGLTGENGEYTLFYLDDIQGAPVGKGKLWIEVSRPADLKRVPPEWSQPGPNIREVKATGNNREGEFNIILKAPQAATPGQK